jgi:single-stranded-DNA-specific exonuclease
VIKSWTFRDVNIQAVRQLRDVTGYSERRARWLVGRGYNHESPLDKLLFLKLKDMPSPWNLPDMEVAIQRVIRAMDLGEQITIYGDYDVDGTVSTSLFLLFFRELGIPVQSYIPHRIREGYSLNANALESLARNGTRLIITVDNGIMAHKEIVRAKSLGMDVIVTDHHQCGDSLPEALAVINPQRADHEFADRHVCGAGVAFLFLVALRQRLRDTGYFANRPIPDLSTYLDLVALATVADMVPLIGLNRTWVRLGLKVLANTRWEGLKALKNVASLSANPDAFDLGFRLGPRLNAVGRLYEASTGVRLLTTSDSHEAAQLAQALDSANRERRVVEDSILKSAEESLRNAPELLSMPALVLAHENWHPGVIGIVASRLVEKWHRPVILLGPDGDSGWKGSGRGVPGVNLVELLHLNSRSLTKFGGHKAAAGLSLPRTELHKFRQHFSACVAEALNGKGTSAQLFIDEWIDKEDLGDDLLEDWDWFGPFGQGHAEPVLAIKNVHVPAVTTNEQDKKFRRFSIPRFDGDSLSAVGFGSEIVEDLPEGFANLAVQPFLDTWKGKAQLKLRVKGWQLL